MHRHRFDPLSAALGAITFGAGVAVVTNAVLTVDTDLTAWWVAAGALVVGVGLIPWRGLAPTDRHPAQPEDDSLDEPGGGAVTSEPSTGSA
jgi:hypothetical protein